MSRRARTHGACHFLPFLHSHSLPCVSPGAILEACTPPLTGRHEFCCRPHHLNKAHSRSELAAPSKDEQRGTHIKGAQQRHRARLGGHLAGQLEAANRATPPVNEAERVCPNGDTLT